MTLKQQQLWTSFIAVDGIGRHTLLKIKQFCQTEKVSLSEVWKSPEKFVALEWKPKQFDALRIFKQKYSPAGYWEFLQQKEIRVVFESDDNYPKLLLCAHDHPLLLFVRGQQFSDTNKRMAVVGTRQMTAYGKYATQKVTTGLVRQGWEIISGCMYGVDTIAHQTCVENHGRTIGVLGYGFDNVYPKGHRWLLDQILDGGGTIISEYAPHVIPLAMNFPQRNRIVAGLSLGVLVTEAALKSGSHITATYAAEYGRSVYAVPGNITNPFCEGTKWLINQGATLISSESDIINDLQPQLANL